MICYRDQSWCHDSEKCGTECRRRYRPEENREDLLVCFAPFRDTDERPGFTEKGEATE